MNLRLSCAAAALSAAAAGSPASGLPPAAGGWSQTAPISTAAPGTLLSDPSLAFSAGGRALVTWGYEQRDGHRGQRAVRREPDGRIGAAHELPWPVEPPLLYRGDRAVALVRTSLRNARTVRVVTGSTSGRFGARRTMYTTEAGAAETLARAVVNNDGRLAIMHQLIRRDGSRRIVLVERSRAGGFGDRTVVADERFCPARCQAARSVGAFAIARGSRGDLVVTWQAGRSIMARVRPAGKPMQPAVRLGPGGHVSDLRAAVSARGAVWAAWVSHPRNGDGNGSLTVRAAVRPSRAARFGRVRALDHLADTEGFTEDSLRLALDPAGAGFVSWSRPALRGLVPRVRLASADARGGALRIRTLSAKGDYAFLEDLATSRRPGEALVVWRRYTDEAREGTQVMAGLLAPDGGYRGQEVVSPSLQAGRAVGGFDPRSGQALVVWPDLAAGAGLPAARRQPVIAAALHG